MGNLNYPFIKKKHKYNTSLCSIDHLFSLAGFVQLISKSNLSGKMFKKCIFLKENFIYKINFLFKILSVLTHKLPPTFSMNYPGGQCVRFYVQDIDTLAFMYIITLEHYYIH